MRWSLYSLLTPYSKLWTQFLNTFSSSGKVILFKKKLNYYKIRIHEITSLWTEGRSIEWLSLHLIFTYAFGHRMGIFFMIWTLLKSIHQKIVNESNIPFLSDWQLQQENLIIRSWLQISFRFQHYSSLDFIKMSRFAS